jgi:HD-like signal output (HDOD) protein/ActR/RegA family two-component response regulator
MKKRILFVDDDPLLLSVYDAMLDGEPRWQCITATNGETALKTLAQAPFDVVVSDMRMPGMDGIELMTAVCRRHPHISRIIISGSGDQEEIARGLETTHQFLTKPVKLGELLATLERIGQLDAYLQDAKLRALAGKLDTLPSFPSAFMQIMTEINSEEPSVEAVADIVIKDPALTAKMLQVANSAAFGLAQKVNNPFEAVQFLGMATVRSLALSAHVFSSFEGAGLHGFSAQKLWDDALLCAQITRTIMQTEKAAETDIQDACTAALLRNTGQLMLAVNFPKEFQQAIERADQLMVPLPTAEQEIFGATHSGIAAYLFGLWGLSAPMVEAVAFHLEPARSSVGAFSPLAAVHVAHVLSQELSGEKVHGQPAQINHAFLAGIGAGQRLDVWRSKFKNLSAPQGI